jgi:hypothetical protein
VKFLNFICLPHVHHLASSVSQPESFKETQERTLY